jgi:hypothetical protein
VSRGEQPFRPLVYSLDAVLPIVDLHQASRWLPDPAARCTVSSVGYPCGEWLRVYLWVHILVGWSLTSLAVAGFTGLVRRG